MEENLKMKKNKIELNRYEKCLIILARHVEALPECEWLIEEEILEELGYKKIKRHIK